MFLRATVAALMLSLGFAASPGQALVPAPTVTPGWTTSSQARIDWTAVSGAAYYRVGYALNDSFTDSYVKKTSKSSPLVLSSLKARTTYHVRVQAVNANAVAISSWSAAKTFTTKPPPVNVVVGTFNVKNQDSTWSRRLPVIARDIQAGYLDVLGIQETYGKDDRAELLAKVNSTGTRDYSMTPAADERAAWDNRILYQHAKVKLVTGATVYAYKAQATTDPDKFRKLVYATFTKYGKPFLFVTTHLAPGNDAVAAQQWNELMYMVKNRWNPNRYPVIVAGDFNSSKWGYEACKMLKPMRDAGFGDVLGQQCKSYTRSPLRVAKLIYGNVNSFNDFNRRVADYSVASGRVGNNIDWIFASNHLKVPQWRTHVTQSGGYLALPIPSDHFMVSAIITLP